MERLYKVRWGNESMVVYAASAVWAVRVARVKAGVPRGIPMVARAV